MAKTIVGRDAVAYLITGGGLDTTINNFTTGPSYSMLGRWDSINIKLSKEWSDVTPSSAEWKEKRRTVKDFKATLSGFVKSGNANAIDHILANDYILVTFTEEQSGRQMNCAGGLFEGGIDKDRDKSKDNLEIEGVGEFDGHDPIWYS